MGIRKYALGLLTVAALAVGGAALASPAWAGTGDAANGCGLHASKPHTSGSTLRGTGSRSGCSDTVTYFWVRVYKAIDFWPDAEKAVKGQQYVQNGNLTASGGCDGRGEHYTYTSTATGASGSQVESGRAVLC